jgi:hypothetical protein
MRKQPVEKGVASTRNLARQAKRKIDEQLERSGASPWVEREGLPVNDPWLVFTTSF